MLALQLYQLPLQLFIVPAFLFVHFLCFKFLRRLEHGRDAFSRRLKDGRGASETPARKLAAFLELDASVGFVLLAIILLILGRNAYPKRISTL